MNDDVVKLGTDQSLQTGFFWLTPPITQTQRGQMQGQVIQEILCYDPEGEMIEVLKSLTGVLGVRRVADGEVPNEMLDATIEDNEGNQIGEYWEWVEGRPELTRFAIMISAGYSAINMRDRHSLFLAEYYGEKFKNSEHEQRPGFHDVGREQLVAQQIKERNNKITQQVKLTGNKPSDPRAPSNK